MSSPTRGRDRSGGFRIEVMPAPRYQMVIDSFMAPIVWLSSWLALEPRALRRNRDTFRVIVRNPQGRMEGTQDYKQRGSQAGAGRDAGSNREHRDRGVESRDAGPDPRVLLPLTGPGPDEAAQICLMSRRVVLWRRSAGRGRPHWAIWRAISGRDDGGLRLPLDVGRRRSFGIVAVEGASRSTGPGLAHLGGIRLGVAWSGR
jgi:hypothetical protein